MKPATKPVGAASSKSNPTVAKESFAREFSAFNTFILSNPSIANKSEWSNTSSVLESPQIIISSDVILSTEGNNVLVTQRNDNFDDEIIL